ncbi:MAG: hypothetical protein RBS01_03375, partial [Candidatus Dojkabacteria bacterium]|nr:hypothetical protein [Candidatus Dojkabacteria bacterium]
MALRLTKTSKIVFAISIVVLSIALGYLVWRVNQEDRLDPSDSDAGGTGTGCSTAVTNACRDTCPEGFNGFLDCKEDGVVCGNVACGTAARCLCCTGQWATADDGDCDKACGTWGYGADCDDEDGDNEVVKCFCESWSDGCGTNCTFPDGTQAEVDSKARASCKPYIAMCNVNDGSISIDEYTSSHVCYNKVAQCKNPYADNPCVETSSCDSGSWVTRPTGNIDFNTDILFSATALDSDGINS